MIENMNANEMIGQMELSDIEGTGNREQGTGEPGYDEAGNLIDYQKPSPMGKVAQPEAVTDEVRVDPEAGMLAEVMGDIARNTAALENRRAKAPDEIRLDTLAAEINAITNHARVVLASAAIDIGKRLIEARGIVPHGRWTEWLAANVDYSERKAQQLMQLAEEFGRGQLPEAFSGLGLSQMTALLAAPEEAREALAEKAKDEDLSVRDLQAEIAKLKAEVAEAQTQIDWHEAMKERLDNNINDVENERDEAEKQLEVREEELKAAEAGIEKLHEAVNLAEAKAAAAESSANELRKLHSDAEDRAAQSAQRASDAVSRANRTAKELAEAKARIAELEREKEAEPEPRTVEVVPEAVRNELADLRRQLAEAQKLTVDTSSSAGAPPTHQGEGMGTAVARFRDSYKRLTDEFKTAEGLIAEIARDDAKTGHMYATAMVKSCRMMIERLGEE